MAIHKVNIEEKLSIIQDYWNPRIAGELNGQQVKLVKFKGPFTMHKHEEEDEMFLVIKGSFDMKMMDKTISLNAGEFIIIPRGTLHQPVAENEVEVMLFEPASTINTGNEINEHTKTRLAKI